MFQNSQLLSVISIFRTRFLVFTLLAVVIGTLDAATLLLIPTLVTKFQGEGVYPVFFSWIEELQAQTLFLLLLTLVYAKNICAIATLVFQSRFIFQVRDWLSIRVLSHFSDLDFQFISRVNKSTVVTSSVVEPEYFATRYLNPLLGFCADSIILVGMVGALLFIDTQMVITLGAVFGCTFYFYQKITKKSIRKFGLRRKQSFELTHRAVDNFVSAIHIIRLWKRKAYILEAIEKQLNNNSRAFASQVSIEQTTRYFVDIFCFSILLLFITVGNDLNISDFFVYLFAAYRLLPLVNRMIIALQSMNFIEGSRAETTFPTKDVNHNEPLIRICDAVNKIEIVNFQHVQSVSNAKVNYMFEKGKLYCIKGASGVGKTTLLNCIVGLDKLYDGSILVDGYDIKSIDFNSNVVGYMPQHTVVFPTNLSANISLEREGLTEAYIRKLSKDFSLDGLISKKDVLSNTNISGGQAQRIGFLRAVVQEPLLLILDEPASSQDLENTRKILHYLSDRKSKCITIITMHSSEFDDFFDEVIQIGD